MRKKLILIILAIFLLNTTCSCRKTVANEDRIVIEKSEYFEVTKDKKGYYYTIYDKNGKAKEINGPIARAPQIIMTEDNIIRITTQAGTGIATQSGYFFDFEQDQISQTFSCIFDQKGDIIAYGTHCKIIVQDIFNADCFYQEFSTFQDSFSPVAFPFTDVSFSADGTTIFISYLAGEDYTEKTEEFFLLNNS